MRGLLPRRRERSGAAPLAALPLLAVGALAAAVLALRTGPSETGPSEIGASEAEADEAWELAEPAPVGDPDRTPLLSHWERLECADCHREVAREWAASRHGLAWVDEPYREELGEMRRPKGCWGCHVPEPLLPAGLPQRPEYRPALAADAALEAAHGAAPGAGAGPEAGSEGAPDAEPVPALSGHERHFGITCESCHLGADDALHGPYPPEEMDAPHAVARSAAFTEEGQSALCIACHATNVGPVIGIAQDFATSGQAEKGRSCIGCHMAVVERPIATDPEGVKTYPVRRGRSHLLQTPRDPGFLRRAFGLAVRADAEVVVLVLENRCGHRVPGLIGRELGFTAELLDEGGKRVARATLRIDNRSYLPTDGTRELRLEGRGATVRVKAVHEAPGLPATTFLEEELAIEP